MQKSPLLSCLPVNVTLHFTAEISGQDPIATHPLISYIYTEQHWVQRAVLSACGSSRREEEEADAQVVADGAPAPSAVWFQLERSQSTGILGYWLCRYGWMVVGGCRFSPRLLSH